MSDFEDVDPGFDPDEEARINDLMRQLGELDAEDQKDALKALEKLLGGKQNQATVLVEISTRLATLWHDRDLTPFATIQVQDHAEHWPIRSRAFRTWLQHQYFIARESAPGSQATQDALAVLEGRARFDGAEHPVFVRVADHDGTLYLDLADDRWRCVEITAAGWQVRDDQAVRFKRRRGMQPLPVPERGGDLADLLRFVNVTAEEWPLVLGWLVGALHPRGPYPVLVLSHEQGCGKTTTSRVLRRMIDPNEADVRAEPRETRDLAIAAANGWIVAFDNLSVLRPGLSDDLARLATGAGFATRTLYENDEETIFAATRPIIVNGIEDVVTRPDLLDRTLLVRPPRIPDDMRRDEATFWAEYDEARPRTLGALLDAVVCALDRLDSVHLERVPRMADFARWVVAAEPALGLPAETFLDAYTANREHAQGVALESNVVAQAILAHVEKVKEWTGTARELAELLKPERPPKDWPVTGPAMAGQLRRHGPTLRHHGMSVDYDDGFRPGRWTFRKTGETTSGTSKAADEAEASTRPDTSDSCSATHSKEEGDGARDDDPACWDGRSLCDVCGAPARPYLNALRCSEHLP